MEDENDYHSHVKLMRNLLKKARDVGAIITDAQFRSIFLDYFPPSWDDITVNVPGSSSDDAINHLKAIWVKREARRIERQAKETKVKALAARSQTQKTSSSIICSNCSRKGHTKERYWARIE
ncbi:hypothetical protein V5O48_009813 [Marasmius crinis-equi]|uniref:Transposase n=1 Tax=Marasmius crinis-equi TaxID=585013 RepID=A0ABR3FA97_9AGAR